MSEETLKCMRYAANKIFERVDAAAAEYEEGRSALGYMEDIAESALYLRNTLDDELAALKAGQGEAVAEFGSDCIFNLRKQPNGERWPAGTKLYTAPPTTADAVSVPVELLERTISNLLYGSARDNADELRALLAQSESKGVKS